MDFQIIDKRRKKNFLVWAKNKFHADEHQQALQEEDFKQGAETEVIHGRNLRWNSELERRLGTAALWHMIRVRGSLPEPIMDSLDWVTEVVSATTACFFDW